MVVNNFLDYVMFNSFYSLLRFVVVNQNNLNVCFVKKIAFAYNSYNAVILVNNRQTARRAFGKQRAYFLDSIICPYRTNFLSAIALTGEEYSISMAVVTVLSCPDKTETFFSLASSRSSFAIT